MKDLAVESDQSKVSAYATMTFVSNVLIVKGLWYVFRCAVCISKT